MDYDEILQKLKSMRNPKNIEGMARYGINPENNYGVSVSTIRELAKSLDKDHNLAQQLWSSGIRDARMVACLIEEPKMVTKKQMDDWIKDFKSWDVCDHCCGSLFDKTEHAYKKAMEWSEREKEYEKRAGFALMAWLAVHDKKAEDREFLHFFTAIKKQATDGRNYVKKAVSWALRNIGKRNLILNKGAIKVAEEIQKLDSKTAHWIANDAISELTSKKIQDRLKMKK